MATKSRLILPPNRLFCSPSRQEKCYIIKTRDAGNKVLYETEILKNFREQQQKGPIKTQTLWDQMIEMTTKTFKNGPSEIFVVVHRLQLDEKLRKLQKSQAANFKIFKEKYQLQTLPGRIKCQLNSAQGSEGFKNAANIPSMIIELSKSSCAKAQIYWGIFLKSEEREKLEKLIISMWVNGRLVALRIIKFIREAYFDKSKKAVRKH